MIIRKIKGGQQNMTKYYEGDKFVIEIQEILRNLTADSEYVYRIKGFNSLVFDDAGLDKLKRYKTYDEAYNDGKKFAESVYTRLFNLSGAELEDIFGKDGGSFKHILNTYTIDKINNMMESYVPSYEIGDELTSNSRRWLVTFIQQEDEFIEFNLMRDDGFSDSFTQSNMKAFRKTGRNFTSIDNFRANKVDKQ